MYFSMFTPDFITRTVQMPTCYYTLRKEGPDGPLVRFAVIGETIFHRWECIQQSNVLLKSVGNGVGNIRVLSE